MDVLFTDAAQLSFLLMGVSFCCCIGALFKLTIIDGAFVGYHVLWFASYLMPFGYSDSGLMVIWSFVWSVGGIICSAILMGCHIRRAQMADG